MNQRIERPSRANELRNRGQEITQELLAPNTMSQDFPNQNTIKYFFEGALWLMTHGGTFLSPVYDHYRQKERTSRFANAIIDYYGFPDESFQHVWVFSSFVDPETSLPYHDDVLGLHYSRDLAGKVIKYQKLSWFKYMKKLLTMVAAEGVLTPANVERLSDDVLQRLQTYITEEASKSRNYVVEFVSGYDLAEKYNVIGSCMSKWNYFTDAFNIDSSELRQEGFLDRAPGIALYAHNPEKVRMALVRKENSSGYLGRALVWKNDEEDGKEYYDRIYTSSIGARVHMEDILRGQGILPLDEVPGLFYVQLNEVGAMPYFDKMTHVYKDSKGSIYAMMRGNTSRYLPDVLGQDVVDTLRDLEVRSTRSANSDCAIDKGVPFFHEATRKIVWRDMADFRGTKTTCAVCGEPMYPDEVYGRLALSGDSFCEHCLDTGAVISIDYRSPHGSWVEGYYDRDDVVYCDLTDDYRLERHTRWLERDHSYVPSDMVVEDYRGGWILTDERVEVYREGFLNRNAHEDDDDIVNIEYSLQRYIEHMEYALGDECVLIDGVYFPHAILRKLEVPQDLLDDPEEIELVELYKRAIAVMEYSMRIASQGTQAMFRLHTEDGVTHMEMTNASV